MTVDEAITISATRTVELWRQCDRERGETPDSLRAHALEVLADAVHSLREDVRRRDLSITLLMARVQDAGV